MAGPGSDQELVLGRSRTSDETLALPARALLRHMMALGSSGSGKTVLSKVVVEEIVRAGVPALCLDPQGDLCSLALAAEDPEALAARGVDPALAREFAERCEVVIFTPASSKGVALGADPLAAALAKHVQQGAIDEEQWTRAAGTIAALLGYAVDDEHGEGFVAVFDSILRELAEDGRPATSLAALSEHLANLDDAALRPYARYWELKPLRQAIRRLARLEVGPRRKLFASGVALDIDLLLGQIDGGEGAVAPGKTRVAIVHLNSLHSQEDKEFLVAAIAERLYAWMLARPSTAPQLLFYLDEIAPYMPPVRKPRCKDSLQLLFKQARKYGVCCLMATQNPGDVDYRAMAQFGTWALGRLMTRQDLKKIEPTVKALAPTDCDTIMASLPRLEPGQFVLLSPDHFKQAQALQTRWLYTQHETLDEGRIEALTDQRWRKRFAALVARDKPKRAAKSRAPKSAKPEPKPIPVKAIEPEPEPPKPTKQPKPKPVKPPKPKPVKPPKPSKAELAQRGRDEQLEVLRSHGPVDAKAFAALLGCSETKARRALKLLAEAGLVGDFKRGRSAHYWALDTGTRPDIGMPSEVMVAMPVIGQDRASEIGRGLVKTNLLGLGGPVETLMNVSLIHALLWRVDFEERIEAGLLGRLVGPRHEQRLGSVYLHPAQLTVLGWDPKSGISFAPRPAEHASDVHDLDGSVRFTRLAPAGLRFDEKHWRARQSREAVDAAVRERWAVEIKAINPCFLPLWKLMIRRHDPAGVRVATLDAIVGHQVDWP